MNKNKANFFDILSPAARILIIGHVRPDGDCLGSGFALKKVCEKMGKTVDFICDSPFPSHYSFMPHYAEYNVQKCDSYDLVICVDCADDQRLGKYIGYIKNSNSVNIDHHDTNNGYCKTNFIERGASSTCEIVFDLLNGANLIDDTAAYYLFIGLSTDTGHFMHRNTNSKAFLTAANLAKYNIDATKIGEALYRQNSIGKTKLIARAIESMRFFHNDEVCLIIITQKDLADCGCESADTEGLTDFGMNIGRVLVTAALCEQNRPMYKVSYRSKSIDVAAAAAVFGGGGHKLASGCMIGGHLEDVVRKIVKSITDGMD